MRLAMLAVLAVVSFPALTHAEDEEESGGLDRDNELSLRLGGYATGATIKIDAEDEVADGGGALGVRFIHNLDRRVGLGLELNGLNAGEHESTKLITNAVSTTKLSTAELLGIVRIRFGRESFRPYLLGGLGIHSTTLELDAQPQAGFVWTDTGTSETRSLVDSTKSGAALALEAGFDYHFNRSLSAGASLGWHFQSQQTYDATPRGRALGLAGVKGSFSGVAIAGALTGRF